MGFSTGLKLTSALILVLTIVDLAQGSRQQRQLIPAEPEPEEVMAGLVLQMSQKYEDLNNQVDLCYRKLDDYRAQNNNNNNNNGGWWFPWDEYDKRQVSKRTAEKVDRLNTRTRRQGNNLCFQISALANYIRNERWILQQCRRLLQQYEPPTTPPPPFDMTTTPVATVQAATTPAATTPAAPTPAATTPAAPTPAATTPAAPTPAATTPAATTP